MMSRCDCCLFGRSSVREDSDSVLVRFMDKTSVVFKSVRLTSVEIFVEYNLFCGESDEYASGDK